MTSTFEGVILAGGKGSRFKPFTDIIPKPLIPIGNREKPILEYIISWLAKNDIKKIHLLVGYKNQQIKNYFDEGDRWGVKLYYTIDDPYEPNRKQNKGYHGTGGALLKTVESGNVQSENLLVWYGDIIAKVDVKKLMKKHIETNSQATLVVTDKYQVPVGIASTQGDKIIELKEKPFLELNATIGILAIQTKIILETESELGVSFDIMSDMIPLLIKKGYNVRAFFHRDKWYDIGSLERYQKLSEDINEILEEMI